MESKNSEKIILLRKEVMHFFCWYQQKEELGERQFWSGSIVRTYDMNGTIEKKIGVSDIEGHISEYQTNIDWTRGGLRFPETRYLLGIDGVNHNDTTLGFTIYPERGRPIDYMFKYDEEDDRFYGVWFFVGNKNKISEYGGYASLDVSKYRGADDNTKADIERSLYGIQAYYNNAEDITDMVDRRVKTLLPHEEVDDSTYASAKAYFKKNAKTLELFRTGTAE